MSFKNGDRPGLLLMWHGDLPDDLPALDEQCTLAKAALDGQDIYGRAEFDDGYTMAGLHIAYHLLSRIKPDHLELSYLGIRPPGIRQAIYRTAGKGARRIICTGAAGLLMPGHGSSRSLPAELRNVILDNPALDLVMARPRLEPEDIEALVGQSLAYSFMGQEGRRKTPWLGFRTLEERGIVLVCTHDITKHSCDGLPAASARLSGASREVYRNGGTSVTTDLIRSLAPTLQGAFHSAASGFMDFALPDVADAARRLIDDGCTHIVAMGMPSLLYRHPYSCTGPDESMERLKKAMPDTSIVYVKPDPAPIASYLTDVLISAVLDADANGRSLSETLRER